MFVFNFIFWLVGCALLAVGIWAKVDERSLSDLIDDGSISDNLIVAAWIMIVLGAIIMVLGFLGCCGAIRESQCMLATFFIFLFIIFAALLAFGIYFYINFKKDPDMLKDEVVKYAQKCVNEYYNSTECKKYLDKAHKEFNCCGAEKGDFEAKHGDDKARAACGDDFKTQKGCVNDLIDTVTKLVRQYLVVFVAVSFGIATVMLLGMIFAMLLCCAIRETMA